MENENKPNVAANIAKDEIKKIIIKKVAMAIGSFLLPLLPYVMVVLVIICTIGMIASAFSSNADNEYVSEIVEENKEFQERISAVAEDIKEDEGVEIDKAVLASTVLYNGNFDEVYLDESEYEGLNDDELEDKSNEELLDRYKTSKRTLKKYAKKQINPDTDQIDLEYYKQYLIDEGIEKLYPDYIKKDGSQSAKVNIANDIMSLAKIYYILFQEPSDCTSGGGCIYDIGGQSVGDIKVDLISCGDKDSAPIKTVSLEDYVMGVVAAEVGVNADPEVIKAQAIAAKSFALTRQNAMCPGTNGKNCSLGYNKETNTIRMRACEADQVYCDPTIDCYRKVASVYGQNISYYSPEIDSNSGGYVWKYKLSAESLEKFQSILSETRGKVAVDANGNPVYTPFTSTQQKKYAELASAGYDYTEIIMKVYSDVTSITGSNCSASSSTGSANNATVEKLIELAQPHLGMNYVFGATGPDKWDCSSFVQHLYGQIGVDLPRNSQMQFNATTRVSMDDIQPGDLIFKDSSSTGTGIHHVAIYVGDGKILHASSPDRGILLEPNDLSGYNQAGRVGASIAKDCGSDILESGPYTQWRQYDPAWGSISLGGSSLTIKSAGCLVTSVAIQIARSGISTPIPNFNPGTFVTTGNKNGMFTGGGLFNWNSPSKIVPGFKFDSALHKTLCGKTQAQKVAIMQSYINQGCFVTLEVKGRYCGLSGSHFVAITGTQNGKAMMVDPASDATEVFAKYGNNASLISCYRAS